jgi:hypothetical protein
MEICHYFYFTIKHLFYFSLKAHGSECISKLLIKIKVYKEIGT